MLLFYLLVRMSRRRQSYPWLRRRVSWIVRPTFRILQTLHETGNTPQYVNRQSNHPPCVLRRIPEAINRRLSHISSDKQSFEAACPPYQDALSKSGYEFMLHYDPETPKQKRTRSRKVTWFNPPYSANVATNIGTSS